MKRLATFSIGLILIIFSCTKTVTKTVTVTVTDTVNHTIIDSNINLSNGLVAYYPFNGDAKDSSGNHFDGTVNGGVTFSNGVSNGAVTFDGSTGYIKVNDPDSRFQTDAVTLSFLINLSDITPVQVFVTDLNFSDGSGQAYLAGMNTTTDNGKFQFGAPISTTACAIPVYDPTAAVTAANTISTNQWYHVVAIFANGLQQIFVNGILNTAQTRTFNSLNKCSANSLIIGGFWQNSLSPFHGSMDELRIYNRALNQNEINALARAIQ